MRDAVPEARIGDQHVIQHAMVALGDVRLHFVEALAVDVGPGVFRSLHLPAGQCIKHLGKGQTGGQRAYLIELGLQNLRLLNTEVQAGCVSRQA
ncbi:hypothetical protein D3C77_694960 [compost metagenome]